LLNPDTAAAISRLVAGGALPSEKAVRLLRVARRELVSVRWELRLLLYGGVLGIASGVGLLVKESLDRIGPAAIAVGIGAAAAGCLAWVVRTAPPFSWAEVPSPNLAFDYLLLLGALLAAADLAYVEVKFTPLGPGWTWHLLIVALGAGAAAVRFDSRVVLSLALSSFAAWRGVSVGRWGEALIGTSEDWIRLNALGCGILFCLLGWAAKRWQLKAHFEPVAVHFGWLLALGALASGWGEDEWPLWALVLLAAGAGLAVFSFKARRFSLFAIGVVAGYAGMSRFVLEVGDEKLGCFWFLATAVLMIVGLVKAQRSLREPV
jgi:hypothetical protein